MIEQVEEQLARLKPRERELVQDRWGYRAEKLASGEVPPIFAAIVVPSYGMSEWETGEKYRLSFFGGVVTRAAFEYREMIEAMGLGAPKIVIEGAVIFPGDPKNDGDLMKDHLLRLGVPESSIVQRKNNHNTYEQLLDSKKALQELRIPQHEALYLYSDLHRQRIPKLMRNYGLSSHTAIAEDFLSEIHPAFARAWERIKSDPSYHEKAERPEAMMTRALWIDPRGVIARKASEIIFARKGADVPDVRHRQTVRNY